MIYLLGLAKSAFVPLLLTSFSFESKSIPIELVVTAGVSAPARSCLPNKLGLSVSFFLCVPLPFCLVSSYGFSYVGPLCCFFVPWRFGVDEKLPLTEFSCITAFS